MKKFIILILVCLLSSCSITRNSFNTHFVDATIFQVLDSNTALAMDDELNVIQIITSEKYTMMVEKSLVLLY